MSDLISWYLVELRLCLGKKFPPARAEEIVNESRLHLRDEVNALVEKGLSAETATKQALLNFGKPSIIASAHSASFDGRGSKNQILTCFLSVLASAGLALTMSTILPRNFAPAAIFGLASLVPVAIASFKLRRVFFGTILISNLLAGCAYLTIIGFFSVSISIYFPERISRSEVDNARASFASFERTLKRQPHWLREGRKVFARKASGLAVPAEYKIGVQQMGPQVAGFRLPGVVYVGLNRGGLYYSSTSDFKYAQRSWASVPANPDQNNVYLLADLNKVSKRLDSADAGSKFSIDQLEVFEAATIAGSLTLGQLAVSFIFCGLTLTRNRWAKLLYAS